jgi:molybdopterin/thiamine biosynthesis adenylyltransferase/rhodanese-related sulfurtransferase
MFSKEELERYSRHLILEGFGIEAQEKLKKSKVLVVGAGGLGSPVLLYLAAAGVGTIGIVDFDIVDKSNLQRQVLYGVSQEGKHKVEAARERLLELNPFVEVNIYNTSLTTENALEIIKDYDVVADGTDNFPTRYLINDACCILEKVNVFASIFRFEGQVTVFNYKNKNGEYGVNYRDLYPEPPPPNLVPNCAEAGVLGVLPGIIGSLQASEVIKIITGVGEPLSGRLFIFDAKSFSTRILKIFKRPNQKEIKSLINYEQFCGIIAEEKNKSQMKSMTVQELKTLQDSGEEFQLIDVREAHEVAISTLGGLHIPMGDVPMNANKINTDMKVVIHCRSGGRSGAIVDFLEKTNGWDNLYNLAGGINAYAKEVDTSLTVY